MGPCPHRSGEGKYHGGEARLESVGAPRRGTTVERCVCESVCVYCVVRVCKVCTLNGLCDTGGFK